MANAKSPSSKPAKRDCYNVTVQGINVKVAKDVIDDIDLLEDLAALDDGDVFAFPRVCKRLFGDDYQRVKGELADKRGITTATAMSEFFEKVLKACNALSAKN